MSRVLATGLHELLRVHFNCRMMDALLLIVCFIHHHVHGLY
jgi:hypothetical protein